tara:strand:+ start:60 stop:233 length:174 start_codon:yes stop_codon:yes gene_type:complete
MDKEIMLLKERIDKLELENCEAENEIEKLKKTIASLNVSFNKAVDIAVDAIDEVVKE